MKRRYVSGREIVESGLATIKELTAYCDSGKLQTFGPAGEWSMAEHRAVSDA